MHRVGRQRMSMRRLFAEPILLSATQPDPIESGVILICEVSAASGSTLRRYHDVKSFAEAIGVAIRASARYAKGGDPRLTWTAQWCVVRVLDRLHGPPADEIAMALVFLASDESSFVGGGELFVDGGFAAV